MTSRIRSRLRRSAAGIRAIAFDLDGTLIDTAPDLAAAANKMLDWLGHPPLPEGQIATFIGSGIDALVTAVLAATSGQTPEPEAVASAVALFRKFYAAGLFAQGRVYPGVMEALQRLQSARMKLGCVTNKPSRFTVPLLECAGLETFFLFVLCADRAEQRKPSPEMLRTACAQIGVAAAELLYVGDSRADIEAARAAGCRVAAVNYGYHKGRPLADYHPDWILGGLTEILALPLAANGIATPSPGR